MYRLIVLTCLATNLATADTLDTASERIEGVYVYASETRYYVADPESGTSRSFPKNEAQVSYSENRAELLEAWRTRIQAEETESAPEATPGDYPAYNDQPKVFVQKGSATWEKRNPPGRDALLYLEYLRNGYSPDKDAARRNRAIYSPNIENLKLQDHLSTQMARPAYPTSGIYFSSRSRRGNYWPRYGRSLILQMYKPIIVRETVRTSDTGTDTDTDGEAPAEE